MTVTGLSADKKELLKNLDKQEPFVSLSVSDAVQIYNTPSLEQRESVPIGDIQQILMATGEWFTIEDNAETNTFCRRAYAVLNARFDTVDIMHPTTQQILNGLVSDNMIGADTKNLIDNLGVTNITPGQSIGISKVRIAHVEEARGL